MTSGQEVIRGWWRDDPVAPLPARALLGCAGAIYRGGRALHRALYASGLRSRARLAAPVVSVGNVTVGGTGKTPFVGWLAGALAQRGRRVVVLGRGYGRAPGASLNDEGAWLAARRPEIRVVQSPDRKRAAAVELARAPADVVLLDDGFQHEPLARELDVVLLDATDPFGNGRLLPRGPLREPLDALRRAGFVFATRAELADEAALRSLRGVVARHAPQARIGIARFEIASLRRGDAREPPERLRGRRVLVLCGVARPDAVHATLARLGATVAEARSYPDHHPFTAAELASAADRARAIDAELVVTAKDAVKLDAFGDARRYLVLEQEVVVTEGGEELLREIERLAPARALVSSASS